MSEVAQGIIAFTILVIGAYIMWNAGRDKR